MAEDSTQIRLAPSGHIWIAPGGTLCPQDVTTAMTTYSAQWAELGYLSEDGVSVTPSYDTSGLKAWQTPVDVKEVLSSVGLTAKIQMLQINKDTTAQYFFGAAWTTDGPVGKLTISSNPSLAERAMVVEWTDDLGFISRFVMPRGFLTDRDSMQLQRTEATALGVTFQCLDSNGVLAYLLSNNPTLAS